MTHASDFQFSHLFGAELFNVILSTACNLHRHSLAQGSQACRSHMAREGILCGL